MLGWGKRERRPTELAKLPKNLRACLYEALVDEPEVLVDLLSAILLNNLWVKIS
jgi:hypothetical protein